MALPPRLQGGPRTALALTLEQAPWGAALSHRWGGGARFLPGSSSGCLPPWEGEELLLGTRRAWGEAKLGSTEATCREEGRGPRAGGAHRKDEGTCFLNPNQKGCCWAVAPAAPSSWSQRRGLRGRVLPPALTGAALFPPRVHLLTSIFSPTVF